MKTSFRSNGNELAKAHAIGNAVLDVKPKTESAGSHYSTVKAPRFDCDFFGGNIARECTSTKRSRLFRKPLDKSKPDQYLEANRLVSIFDRDSRDVAKYVAEGKSKFKEGERNGIAEKIFFFVTDQRVEMREGNPTVWDTKARAKAKSIDWNIRNETSVLTGGVSTTYFNQKKTGGAAPFTQKNSPVYITAKTGRFDHRAMSGVYTGNARAWQNNSYVKGEKIYIEEKAGRFYAEGSVSSMVYNSGGANNGNQPVFVNSGSLLYLRDKQHVRYEKNVDMRQGKGRVMSDTADVFLNADNEATEMVVTGSVKISEPGRKATGNYVRHVVAAETYELRGDPATFSDVEVGDSTGKIINVDLKKKRSVNSGSSTNNGTGRTRTVYKVRRVA